MYATGEHAAMALETVLLAVGEGDKNRIDGLANTARDIAGPADARVALLHVFTQEEYETARDQLEFDPQSEVTPDAVAKRYATIRDLGDAMDAADIEFTWHGRIGDQGDRIIDTARELGADLIIIGGRQRSPAGKAVFGSTAQEVLLNAPCPVTFVRGNE